MKDALKKALTAFFVELKAEAKMRPIILMGLGFIEGFLSDQIDKLFA